MRDETHKIRLLTNCLKMSLLVLRNEAASAELGRRAETAKRLERFVDEIMAEASLSDLTPEPCALNFEDRES